MLGEDEIYRNAINIGVIKKSLNEALFYNIEPSGSLMKDNVKLFSAAVGYSAQIGPQSAYRYKPTRGVIVEKATTPSLGKTIIESTVNKYTLTAKQTYFIKGYSNKDKVKEIHHILNLSGVLDKPISEDGSFGNGTEKALKKFQKKYGLVTDGIVDTQTLAALRA